MGCLCLTFREGIFTAPRCFPHGVPHIKPSPHEGSREPRPSPVRVGFSFWHSARHSAVFQQREPRCHLAGAPLWLLSVASLCGGRFAPRRRHLSR
jgi:hypothetical protein